MADSFNDLKDNHDTDIII